MNILVAGAHGNTGKQIVNLLLERDHQVRAMIRDGAQSDEMSKLGADPIIADLEQDISFAVQGCDAVIFAAGSGPDTGSDKTVSVDRDGAIKLIKACEENAVNRFVMLSAAGADDPEAGTGKLQNYLKAKSEADKQLMKSKLNYTIIRPGTLTDNDETGKIRVAKKLDTTSGDISRADVATAIVESLDQENTYRKTFEILSGDNPIGLALATFGIKPLDASGKPIK